MNQSPTDRTATASGVAATEASPTRLKSVDVLRGFDMFWIIGGAGIVRALDGMEGNTVTTFVATQLTHVAWEGLRFYDLIFPLFLFLVGVSIVFSMDKSKRKGTNAALVARIARRGILLFAFGLVYHGGLAARWPDVRLSGVLQLIALCYVGASLLYLALESRLKGLAMVTLTLLAANWVLLTHVPFPDFTLNEATVSRLAVQAGSSAPSAVTAQVPGRASGSYAEGYNLSNHLDYRFLPGRKVNGYHESQGLLSPLSAVTICLAGIFAGRWLRTERATPRRKAGWLLAAGLVAVAIGMGWGEAFPLVKKLWTASFCLVTAGWSAVLLAGFYGVIDVWQRDRWCAPWLWLGRNAITIYLAYELIRFDRIAQRLVGGDVRAFLDEHLAKGGGALAQALVALGLALLLARFLHERKIFLRV